MDDAYMVYTRNYTSCYISTWLCMKQLNINVYTVGANPDNIKGGGT